jgi:hypothetical protein
MTTEAISEPTTAIAEPEECGSRCFRFVPRASVRIQLLAAATMWAVGSGILLFRGLGYVSGRYWHAWILGIALVIGVVKARYMLDRVATKAVERIRKRGNACFFGFFSVKSWALVALMMGGGIAIRNIVVAPGVIGQGILGALYLGIGTALFLADRVFWHAALRPVKD